MKPQIKETLCTGSSFALILKIVKCETLTYSARSFEESGASAPERLARSEHHGEALSASRLASRLWLMLSFQIMAYFAKVKENTPKVQLVRKYGATDEDGGRMISVTLNRKIRRKLARLERLGKIGAPKIGVQEPHEDDDLTITQYMEKLIRTGKWNRVLAFGLGLKRRERQALVMGFAGLQGCAVSLRRAIACLAPLSPD